MSQNVVNAYRFAGAGGVDGILAAGSSPSGATDITETYDFTSFTTVTAFPVATTDFSGGGSASDALMYGGNTRTSGGDICGSGANFGFNSQCYSYAPDAWTTENNLNTCTRSNMGGGTSSSGMKFGGDTS